MATKKQIIEEIFKITENPENMKKLHGNYWFMKFLGLNWDYTQKKTSMAVNLNRFSGFEYKTLLDEIKKAIA